jgi:hypothetical protein
MKEIICGGSCGDGKHKNQPCDDDDAAAKTTMATTTTKTTTTLMTTLTTTTTTTTTTTAARTMTAAVMETATTMTAMTTAGREMRGHDKGGGMGMVAVVAVIVVERMSDCVQGIEPCEFKGKGHRFRRLGW